MAKARGGAAHKPSLLDELRKTVFVKRKKPNWFDAQPAGMQAELSAFRADYHVGKFDGIASRRQLFEWWKDKLDLSISFTAFDNWIMGQK